MTYGALMMVALTALSVPDTDVQDWTAETDTVVDVDVGDRLELRNQEGDIVVRTWDRSAVRVVARHRADDRIRIVRSGSMLRVRSNGYDGPVHYELTVPERMPLNLWGSESNISVTGLTADVEAESVEGMVSARDGEGLADLHAVEGDVRVEGWTGRIEITSGDGDLFAFDVAGDVFAETIDGDIRLERLRSAAVEAKTVDGDVIYDGTIEDSGRYRLTSHDGDIRLTIPGNANATVEVSTFDGEFETSFPVQVTKMTTGRRFSFVVGDGGARVELHSFDGDIRLFRR